MSNLPGYGAVDLGALAAAREAKAKSAQATAEGPVGVIKDVTTASFEADVLQQSMTVPVVIDLWATWCGPCKTLSPVLEKLATEYGGRFVLAKIDVDAEQQIAAAFQVQSIPAVFAVVQGQPLPLFQGAYPEPEVRKMLDALLAEATRLGVTGMVGSEVPAVAEAVEEPVHPGLDAAYDAVEAGDWPAAAAAYQSVLAANPKDPDAAAGLRLVSLYQRNDGVDPIASLHAAAQAADDVPTQLAAADAEALNGDWSAAFDRLIGLVKRTAGDDRAVVRARVVEMFELAGPDEPSLSGARIALANALF